MTVGDYKKRLSAAAAYDTITDTPDGRPWYRLDAICRALQLDTEKALRSVRREYKHTVWVSRWPMQRRRSYLSRTGVETLILLKGGLPRAEMLEALDRATAPP